jgi:hypothetical protein
VRYDARKGGEEGGQEGVPADMSVGAFLYLGGHCKEVRRDDRAYPTRTLLDEM